MILLELRDELPRRHDRDVSIAAPVEREWK
jgi:hypothetical protein